MNKKLSLIVSTFVFGFAINTALATAGPGVGCRVLVAPESCQDTSKCTFYVVKYGAALQVNLNGKSLNTLNAGDTITIMGVNHVVKLVTKLSNGDFSIDFNHTGNGNTGNGNSLQMSR